MGDKVDQAYASTLRINHYQPDKTPWRRLGQCKHYANEMTAQKIAPINYV
jgi:hypothetical protein